MSESEERDRYRRMRELFTAALECEAELRAEFLVQNCDDIDVRRDVERLLAADGQADAFGTHAELHDGASAHATLVGASPENIGRYRILRRLGEGGMGSVFAAEQDHPRRTVALKVMHAGSMTPAMLRRFEYEGEVLARLTHPGIAHVFEAGTADIGGVTLPFFAMELVHGRPITRFAVERKLSIRERLALLARVCDAVEHAHHSGVIHRDLKPHNILVVDDGSPKVLDFGVARSSEGDDRSNTLRTQSGMIVGTLAYMSPEQASGDPRALDTRSDVYSLGVIAYELVTGRLPHDLSKVSIARAAKIITDEEPRRPSSIDRRLRGDVETIVSKALEKDKLRRYPSAQALASDLRAFLADQPISARPSTTMYHVAKFTKRHPGLVFGLFATISALIVGLIVSLAFYSKSETARLASEQAAAAEVRASRRSDSINTFVLKEMFQAPDPWSPSGKDVTVASVLDRISNKVSTSFAGDPELEADAHATLAGSYLERGMVDRGAKHAALALDLRRALHAGDDRDLADSLLTQARARAELGDLKSAETEARAALDMFERIAGTPPERIAEATKQVARIRLTQGDHAGALQGFERVLAARRAQHGEEHPAVAQALSDVLAVRLAMGDTVEAERLAREVLALRRRLHSSESPFVALSLNDLSAILYEKGDEKDAEEVVRIDEEAAAILTRALGPEHRLTLLTQRNLANALVRLERNDEALEILRDVVAMLPGVIGSEHEDYVQTLNSYGHLLFGMGRLDEAAVQYERAIEIGEKAFGPEHDVTLRPLANLAYLEAARGFGVAKDRDGDGRLDLDSAPDLKLAAAHFRRVLAGFEKLYGVAHSNTIGIVYGLGDLLERVGESREAAQLLGRYAQGLLANKPAEYEQTITRVLMREGLALMRAGTVAEAEPVLRDCVSRCREVFGEHDWRTAICAGVLGDCLTRLSAYDEAGTLLEQSRADLEAVRSEHAREFASATERLAKLFDAQGLTDRAQALRSK